MLQTTQLLIQSLREGVFRNSEEAVTPADRELCKAGLKVIFLHYTYIKIRGQQFYHHFFFFFPSVSGQPILSLLYYIYCVLVYCQRHNFLKRYSEQAKCQCKNMYSSPAYFLSFAYQSWHRTTLLCVSSSHLMIVKYLKLLQLQRISALSLSLVRKMSHMETYYFGTVSD